jgi:hypothetical protein
LIGSDPLPDVRQQFLSVLFKHFRGHLVTGRPVIHIGQKRAKFPHALCKILPLRYDKGVKLIFLKILMGQRFQKCINVLPLCQLLRHLPKRGRAHTDHGFFVDRRYQLCLEIPVDSVLL